MKLGLLDSKNSAFNEKRWCHLEALAKGGEAFHALLGYFLPPNPAEPDDVYQTRKQQAHYRSYMGSIINLYSSWVFAANFSVKPRDHATRVEQIPDVFYTQFAQDVGNETKLSDFMKERFRRAMTTTASHWLIELPSNGGQEPLTKLEYEDRGLGRAWLKPIDQCELWDWECNEQGALTWAVLHTEVMTRESWMSARDMVTETWKIYDAEQVHTFVLKYKKGERPRNSEIEVPSEPSAPHGFKRVPLVRLCVPIELAVGEQTHDTQLEHFREANALSWLIRRTCYAQPVFNVEDAENSPPRLGAGYAIMLGKDDKFGWTSPPVAPFDVLQNTVDTLRDEIYRIVHQMAQGLDNNADTVGRSADSKEADEAATRILLATYGDIVAKSIEETYEIISEARGESHTWSVEGFSGYDTATASKLLANVALARTLGIPSQTATRTLVTKAVMALLPEADSGVKDAIRDEINKATFEASSLTDAQLEIKAAANLNEAKATSEPIKAQAALKSASRPAAPPPK